MSPIAAGMMVGPAGSSHGTGVVQGRQNMPRLQDAFTLSFGIGGDPHTDGPAFGLLSRSFAFAAMMAIFVRSILGDKPRRKFRLRRAR